MTVPISINLPLPIDVANNLMLAIGELYPNSMWEQAAGAMKITIPDSDRHRKNEIKEAIENLDFRESDPNTNISYTNLSPELISFTGVGDIAKYCLPIVESAFAEFGAENFLEYQFQNPTTHQRYHLIFQKSDKFTPAQLRQQAVDKLEETERELADYKYPLTLKHFTDITSLGANTVVSSKEGNVLVVTDKGIFTIGTSEPVTEETEGFSAPYTVLRKG